MVAFSIILRLHSFRLTQNSCVQAQPKQFFPPSTHTRPCVPVGLRTCLAGADPRSQLALRRRDVRGSSSRIHPSPIGRQARLHMARAGQPAPLAQRLRSHPVDRTGHSPPSDRDEHTQPQVRARQHQLQPFSRREYGMERIMGRAQTPVRNRQSYASDCDPRVVTGARERIPTARHDSVAPLTAASHLRPSSS